MFLGWGSFHKMRDAKCVTSKNVTLQVMLTLYIFHTFDSPQSRNLRSLSFKHDNVCYIVNIFVIQLYRKHVYIVLACIHYITYLCISCCKVMLQAPAQDLQQRVRSVVVNRSEIRTNIAEQESLQFMHIIRFKSCLLYTSRCV